MNRSGLQRGTRMTGKRNLARGLGCFGMAAILVISLGWPHGSASPADAGRQDDAPASRASPDQPKLSFRMSRLQALLPDWQHQCVAIEERAGSTREQQALVRAIGALRRSDLGRWLTDEAARRSVLVCLDEETELEGYYRAHLHMIGLNARLSDAGRLVFLAHELAHVPQHPRFSNNRRFSPEDMLLLHRVREATAEAVATRVLFQLRALGLEAPWQAKLDTAYGDIADLFEQRLGQETGEAAELQAARSAFLHWFEASWRLDIYDDLMLKTLGRIAHDHLGILPASRYLSDRYLLDISNYDGRQFLIEGDGRTLMSAFGASWRVSDRRARLHAMLRQAKADAVLAKEEPQSIEGTALSASSSGPIAVEPE